MDDEIEVIAIDVESIGGKAQRVVLTNRRVFAHLNQGVSGELFTSIPLGAVNGVSFGWARDNRWLLLGVVGLLGAVVANGGWRDLGPEVMALCVGAMVVGFLAYIFYTPGKLQITSGTVVIAGKPSSRDAALAFMTALIQATRKPGD